MIDYSDFKCAFLTLQEIRIKSEDFRKKYWPENELPVDIEKIIDQRLALNIIPESNIKTDAYLQGDLTAIVVDLEQYMDEHDRYSNRLRFSLAHEVGHYILHHSIYDQYEVDTEEEYYSFIENIPDKEYKSFEWQANEFAGSLLVPRKRLIEEIQKIYEKIKKENMLELLEKYPLDILARVSINLSQPFGISTTVIERRVEVEKIWPPE